MSLKECPADLDAKEYRAKVAGHAAASHLTSAYEQCVLVQNEIKLDIKERKEPTGEFTLGGELIRVRLMGHLLDNIDNDAGLHTIYYAIVSCKGRKALVELGDLYLGHFVRTFVQNRSTTPARSHPSRPSFDRQREQLEKEMEQNTLDHRGSKQLALRRDRYHCMVTGDFDSVYGMEWMNPGERPTETQCAHILSESTNTNLDRPEKRQYAATVWSIFEGLGYEHLHKTYEGKNIHRLENIMTLDVRIHMWFDRLDLWFEAIPNEPNRYKVCVANPVYWSLVSSTHQVHFTTNTTYPLPHPDLLQLHALACRVSHLSGASKFLDELYRRLDDYDPHGPVPADTLSMALESLPVNRTSVRVGG